jgi:ribosome-binding factor A
VSHREYNRTDRVNAELRRQIGLLVHAVVRDGLLPEVSVSDVETTRDLAHANVYVTALIPEQAAAAVKALNGEAKAFRRELARTMRMRTVPELHFRYDDSVDRGERIDELLRGADR